MITLYRVAECPACDEVQESLRELVVAHQVVDIGENGAAESPAALKHLASAQELPVIADGEQIISGKEALRDYLEKLAREIEEWRKFQVDACYIDDKGEAC